MSGGSKLPRRARSRGPLLNDLPRRAFLTIKHHGWRELVARLVTAPLRLFGEDRRARARLELWADQRQGRQVVPRGRPPRDDRHAHLRGPVHHDRRGQATASHRRPQSRTRILVVDDGSARQDQEKLLEIEGAEVELATANRGYAASVNRGLGPRRPRSRRRRSEQRRHRPPRLATDTAARRLRRRRHQASWGRCSCIPTGVSRPPARTAISVHWNGLITVTDSNARTMGRPRCPTSALAVTGAAMYLRRSLIDRLGEFDENFPDGIRGRRLLPAGVGGRIPSAL